ncbi:MAG: tetratricopeptide repeat protein [Chloroflexi bacterium]|nr:tetratricopeptide repeat protein [Chloroflexota bacterium]
MSPEEKEKLKKYWVEQAVALAMQNRWEEAVATNQSILAIFPADADAHNRLGKALTELGRYTEAQEAYSRTLQLDPSNSIAQKNLQRLNLLLQARALTRAAQLPLPPEREPVVPQLFIAETGKTGVTTLVKPASQEVLARVTAGTPVHLRIDGSTLVVESRLGDRLGEIEPKLGQRLIHLMRGGNQYVAAITALNNHSVKIIIRETYQHPSQAGKTSFPAKGAEGSTFRPYIKPAVLRYELEGEEGGIEEEEEEEEEVVSEEVAGEYAVEEVERSLDEVVAEEEAAVALDEESME